MSTLQAHAPATASPSPRSRTLLPAILVAIVGTVVVGLLSLLWFGLAQRDRGTVGIASVPFRTAPDFTLGLFDGASLRLQDELAAGRPVVVNFWASWCVPCRDEALVLESGWRRERGQVAFVGVDVQDIETDARAFLARYGTTYPNGAGGAGAISVAYGMRGVPETYFIAPDGTIVRKWNGPLTAAGLDQFLAELKAYSGSLGR